MKNRKIQVLSIIILLVIAFFAFDIPYFFTKLFLTYDSILYEGTIYYFTENIPHMRVDFDKNLPVNLVIGAKYVCDRHVEYAHPYIGDTEGKYLYYGSATFSSDKRIAIPPYGDNQ